MHRVAYNSSSPPPPLLLLLLLLPLLLLLEGDIRLFFAAVQFRVFCQLSAHRFGGRFVFGLVSLTSLMSRCSALLTCSFHAFLLFLTNFTTPCKLHPSRMSTFFIQSNLVLPRMALKVFISVVLKSCFVLVVAALVSAP